MNRVLTAPQRDLLVAACGPADQAAAAWQRWSDAADLDALEPGAYQLMPLVYRNLEQHNPPGVAFRKAAAICRHTWLANEIALRAALRAVTAVQARNIDVAVIGDAAVTLAAYPDLGTRAIAVIDFLVRRDALADATAALIDAGVVAPSESRVVADQPIAAVNRGDPPLRLAVAVPPLRNDRFTRRILAGARPVDAAGTSLPVAAAADLLLIVCERLAEWDATPALPLLADAWCLLGRVPPGSERARFMAFARDECLTLTVDSALDRLRAAGAEPLPASVAGSGGEHRWCERWEYRLKGRAPDRWPGRGVMLDLLRCYRERSGRAGATALDRAALPARLPAVLATHLWRYARDRISGRYRTAPIAATLRENAATLPDSPASSSAPAPPPDRHQERPRH